MGERERMCTGYLETFTHKITNSLLFHWTQSWIMKKKKKPFFANLPQDLIIDILLRLPVKTLVSCSYVCKLWLSLISNPLFINTHLQISNLSNNYSDRKLMVNVFGCGHDDNGPFPFSFIKSLSLDNESNVVLLDYPIRDPRNRIRIVGSCNGLVCIYFEKVGIFIWNPCTGISNKLPHSVLQLHKLAGSGFGYDPFSDDYKVVLIMVYAAGSGPYDFKPKRAVYVYSLKSNSWRKTVDLHCPGDSIEFAGKYVNGVLHWVLVQIGSNRFKPVIVSLDLVNETFGEIEHPCYDECCNSSISLGVLEGCLSVFCKFKDPHIKFCTEIWVMKEYGVRDTWTKLYTIPFTDKHIHYGPYYTPLCISVTGEILLEDGNSLVLYNPKIGSFRNPNFSDCSKDSQTLTYVESLVSPNIYEEVSIAQS